MAIRQFVQNLNTISDVFESTCEDKWDVILETALPAAGEVAIVLFTPSTGEILENYLSPNNRRGGSKGRQDDDRRRRRTPHGGLRRAWRKGIPDVDSLIADRIPGARAVRARRVGPLQRFAFQAIDVADRIAWYWMLIELTDEFVYQWASGIMESRFCTAPHDHIWSAERNESLIELNTEQFFPPPDNNGYTIHSAKNSNTSDADPILYVRNQDADGNRQSSKGVFVANLSGRYVRNRSQPGGEVAVRMRIDLSYNTLAEGTVWIQGTPHWIDLDEEFNIGENLEIEETYHWGVTLVVEDYDGNRGDWADVVESTLVLGQGVTTL